MLIKHIDNEKYFIAGDGSILAEVIHPDHDTGLNVKSSIAYATVAPGQRTHRHRLLNSSETYCIISGTGFVTIEQETAEVSPGTIVHIPPGAWMSLANFSTEPLHFYCVVDPAWRAEDEEVLELE